MKNNHLYFLLIIIAATALATRAALADVVVLTSGERFTSSKVWEENGKLLFDLQGLVVSVNKSDVATVIHGTDPSPEQPQTDLPAAAAQPDQPPPAPVQSPEPDPQTPEPAGSTDPDAAAAKPKVSGIGLDGLAWQMQPNEINGIKKLNTDPSYGGLDQYWWPAGNLTLGDVILDGLVFGFWRNQLYSIMVWVDGHPGYLRMQKAVFERYGDGLKNKNGLERYVWLDDTTDRMLEFDTRLNTGIFWMRSKKLDRRIKMLFPEQ